MADDRIDTAHKVRMKAADMARERAHPEHKGNGDEQRFASVCYAMSFTKGLEHDGGNGLLKDPGHFEQFRAAIDAGFIDPFTATVPGVMDEGRAWEAPTAGVVYDLQGPDAQAVTMAPAPAAGSDELCYEMAEVYWLAALRDCPLVLFSNDDSAFKLEAENEALEHDAKACHVLLGEAVEQLNGMDFDPAGDCCAGERPRSLAADEHGNPVILDGKGKIDKNTAFRGTAPGEEVGPYLSQFMLIGTGDQTGQDGIADGRISYGAVQIDQRVAYATPSAIGTFDHDYMTDFGDWVRVQNGGNVRNDNDPAPVNPAGKLPPLFETPGARRFITTPRDLATYVHDDALYEAYLNACLILLGMKTPFDPGFDALSGGGKWHSNAMAGTLPRKAGGFALYGGPHILTLVTEVATRALKAVRFQKFNTHIRLRPEVLAARIEKAGDIEARFKNAKGVFTGMAKKLEGVTGHIEKNPHGTKLLPMAFQEGSPMHPSYGAGHATVAGACVTILKAFFDTSTVFVKRETDGKTVEGFMDYRPGDVPSVYVPFADGSALCDIGDKHGPYLTLEGELNKLAANISIGRNMAGVHYFSDYYDSLRMGEEIAIGMLEEQALCYPTDDFVLSLPTYDGDVVRIGAK